MQTLDFVLRGEHIALDALLKATGLADSGGRAKTLIQAGSVQVDGATELRRSRKLRAGQRVDCGGIRVCIGAPAGLGTSAAGTI
jgi:ribosome-associated protein